MFMLPASSSLMLGGQAGHESQALPKGRGRGCQNGDREALHSPVPCTLHSPSSREGRAAAAVHGIGAAAGSSLLCGELSPPFLVLKMGV